MHLEPFLPLKIGNDLVYTSLRAHNLWSIFYECLTMENQVSVLSHGSFFHLRNIEKSECYLTEMSLLIVAHACITNKMDYCNSLLSGLPNTLLDKPQHNSTTKLITSKHTNDHNTPELIKLHWFPVK